MCFQRDAGLLGRSERQRPASKTGARRSYRPKAILATISCKIELAFERIDIIL